MNENTLFFVNILPSNDRRTDSNPFASLCSFVNKGCEAGFKHTLITVGDKRLDPWAVAQYCLEKNPAFNPLIAVNPAYQHPSQIAKKVSVLNQLFGRQIAINLVSGSFARELTAINDGLDFSGRNKRLKEFAEILQNLLKNKSYSFDGEFYKISGLELYPKSTCETPFFISGSFENDCAAMQPSPFFIRNIRPLAEMLPAKNSFSGLGLGICARPTDAQAMSQVQELFPADRAGELLFGMSNSNNLTPWNVWLKKYLQSASPVDPMYFLPPLTSFLSAAPFLVGSYETVCLQIKRYRNLGYNFFLLDFHQNDFDHVKICMNMLREKSH